MFILELLFQTNFKAVTSAKLLFEHFYFVSIRNVYVAGYLFRKNSAKTFEDVNWHNKSEVSAYVEGFWSSV